MCGIAVTAVSIATALLIKDPPVGKFINQKKVQTLPGSSNAETRPAHSQALLKGFVALVHKCKEGLSIRWLPDSSDSHHAG